MFLNGWEESGHLGSAAILDSRGECVNAGSHLRLQPANPGLQPSKINLQSVDGAIERGMAALRRLDAIVRNTFRDDAVALAAWESAKHVERAPRPKAKPEQKKEETQKQA